MNLEIRNVNYRRGVNKPLLFLWLLWGVVLLTLVLALPNAEARWKPDVGLWLARSCVGEAGWKSAESGECVAIAHIYKKRAQQGRYSFFLSMRKYSAAIKPGCGKTWVRELSRNGKKPDGFNNRLKWSLYREKWFAMLEVADSFVNSVVPDPLPRALHYGGWVDRHNLSQKYWERIPNTGFRNMFYAPTTRGFRRLIEKEKI